MNIKEFDNFCNKIFNIESFKSIDYSLNGIQVSSEKDIKKIAFAVDASLETFVKAKEIGANLLFVHHGIFWNGAMHTIKDDFYKRVSFLIKNDLALYACHLPLDAQKDYGNASYYLQKLKEKFEIKNYYESFEYKKIKLGYKVELKNYENEKNIYDLFIEGQTPLFYMKRKEKIKTLGFVTGGGLPWFDEAINSNIDIFITGDINHKYYHKSKENNTSLLSLGHYNNERGGVLLFMEKVKKDLNLEVEFIEVKTGL